MSDEMRVSRPEYGLLPAEIDGFDSLAELALDLHWSWNRRADELWRTLDSVLWKITQNPWKSHESSGSNDHKAGAQVDHL